jgi:hypothetical protein
MKKSIEMATEKLSAKNIRFLTQSQNKPMNVIGERLGFKLIFRKKYISFRLDPKIISTHGPDALKGYITDLKLWCSKNFSEESINLSHLWIDGTKVSTPELQEILSNLGSFFSKNLMVEWDVLPIKSVFPQHILTTKQFLILKEPPALVLRYPSEEGVPGVINISVHSLSKSAVYSALYRAFNQWVDFSVSKLTCFFPLMEEMNLGSYPELEGRKEYQCDCSLYELEIQ